MNENVLISAAAVLLSAAFNWIPKLREWYTAKDADSKRLIMLGALVLATLAVFGTACTGFQIPNVVWEGTCNVVGAKELGQLFINAVVLNQAAFLILPKPAH